MKKTRQVIFVDGCNEELVRKALKIISGFKAVTVINSLNYAILNEVFDNNKSCVISYQDACKQKQKTLNNYPNINPVHIYIVYSDSSIEIARIGINHIITDFPVLMDELGIDIGDHISENANTSAVSKEEFLKKCKMCKIAKDCNDVPEGVFYESENFFVDPTIGAFADGYVMIIPKKHITSFAELSDSEFEEFLDVLEDLKFILESVYHKKIFLFEGGSGKGGEGKHITSIVHAHIHLIPSNIPIMSEVQKNGVFPRLIKKSNEIKKENFIKQYAEKPYLLIIDQDDNWYIEDNQNVYYPRQFPRMILAEYMGLSGDAYNWRINPLKERIVSISEHIRLWLAKNFKKLPASIQNNTIKHL